MPYDSPMKKKGSSCMQMKDHKGKPSGLMMEGSVAHQESAAQEKKNLLKDMPIDSKASAMEMSPYKMGHESPAKMGHKGSPMHDNHDKDERSGKAKPFMDPGAPEGFTADAPDVGEAASKKFFKSQDIVNKAVQTLESIEGGKTPYTGYANAASTVKQALLGGKGRKDKLTTSKLKSLAKSDPVKGMEYLSRNIRTAPLGDARSQFDKSYNPFK